MGGLFLRFLTRIRVISILIGVTMLWDGTGRVDGVMVYTPDLPIGLMFREEFFPVHDALRSYQYPGTVNAREKPTFCSLSDNPRKSCVM